MLSWLCALFFGHVSVVAQGDTTTTPDDRVIDFEGCFADIAASDEDNSGNIEKEEYLNFINVYGQRLCWSQETMTLQQHGTFNVLACLCQTRGRTADVFADVDQLDRTCCIGSNAKLPTAGVNESPEARSDEDSAFLTRVCRLTDRTLEFSCDDGNNDGSRGNVIIGNSENPPEGSVWALVMGGIGLILFLLIICACCCSTVNAKPRRRGSSKERARTKKKRTGQRTRDDGGIQPRDTTRGDDGGIRVIPGDDDDDYDYDDVDTHGDHDDADDLEGKADDREGPPTLSGDDAETGQRQGDMRDAVSLHDDDDRRRDSPANDENGADMARGVDTVDDDGNNQGGTDGLIKTDELPLTERPSDAEDNDGADGAAATAKPPAGDGEVFDWVIYSQL